MGTPLIRLDVAMLERMRSLLIISGDDSTSRRRRPTREFAVVAIAGEAAGAHRAHDGLHRELGRLDLEQVDRGLEVEGRQRALVVLAVGIIVEIGGDDGAQLRQRHLGRGEMRRAGRHLAVGAAGGLADEALRAIDGGGGDAGPDRRPAQMRDRRHGLRMDLFVGFREDLLGRGLCLQLEAGAAGAAHAERFPAEAASPACSSPW